MQISLIACARALGVLRLLVAVFGLAASPAGLALEKGRQAPDADLTTASGTLKLDQFRGSVVYLDFWASWCAPCRQSFPWMNSMQSKYGGQGLKIIAVNLDAKADDSRRFLAAVPASFAIAFDPQGLLARRFEVQGMPSSVLIGRDGKVVLQHVGFNEASRDKLEASIRATLETKP